MKLLAALIVSLTVLASTPALAAPRVLSGAVTEHGVEELTSQILWYQSLPEAEAVAQQQGKMIFWMQMLGNLSGAT